MLRKTMGTKVQSKVVTKVRGRACTHLFFRLHEYVKDSAIFAESKYAEVVVPQSAYVFCVDAKPFILIMRCTSTASSHDG